MKTLIISFFCSLVFFSCSNQTEERSSNSDTVISQEPIIAETEIEEEENTISFDNPPTSIEEAKLFLGQFMVASRVDSFLSVIKKYELVSTDTALIEFYRNDAEFIINAIYDGMQKSHPDVEYAGDSEPATAWSWVNSFLPIKTECLSSEGDSEAYKYLPDFMKKAKSTNGDLDNELFRLLNIYYDDYDGTWLTIGYDNAGCDYCGYSTFGNGKHINLFKEIILVEKKTTYLDKELKSLISSMIDFGGTAFGSSKNDILNEINAFLELKDSTRFDISKLKEEKDNIVNANKNYIFECTYDDFMNN